MCIVKQQILTTLRHRFKKQPNKSYLPIKKQIRYPFFLKKVWKF
jgi:hypothetical protein